MDNKSFKNQIVSLSRTVILSSITIFALYSVSAWTGPAGAPTGGNVAGPVTLSTTAQTKAGAFTAVGLTSTEGLTVGNAANTWSAITLKDDESVNGVKYVHANSNVIGFLGGSWTWLAYWDSAGNQTNVGSISAGGNINANDICTNGGKCLSATQAAAAAVPLASLPSGTIAGTCNLTWSPSKCWVPGTASGVASVVGTPDYCGAVCACQSGFSVINSVNAMGNGSSGLYFCAKN